MNNQVHNPAIHTPEGIAALAAKIASEQKSSNPVDNYAQIEQQKAKLNDLIKAEAIKAEEEKKILYEAIKANFEGKVDVIETKFNFRTVTEQADYLDQSGEKQIFDEKTHKNFVEVKPMLDKSGKSVTKNGVAQVIIECKRPSVILPVASPNVEGILDIITKGGKGLELLLEACSTVINSVARNYINENETVTTENFPFNILGWEAIANMPKAERRGGGISKDTWEDFVKDYIEVMPAVTGKTLDRVTMAGTVLLAKWATVKTNKPVIKVLIEQLAIYLNSTPNAEAFMECVDFLVKKGNSLLETDSSSLLEAL